jgi:HK97 family phage portal protein
MAAGFSTIRKAAARIRVMFSGRGGGNMTHPARSTIIPGARFDWRAEAGDPRQNAVSALAIDWVTRNSLKVRPKLYRMTRSGTEVEITNHPIIDLLKRPNPVYGGRSMLVGTIVDYLFEGDAYWYVAKTNRGTPGEIYRFDARYVAPDFPTDGRSFMHGWRYTPAGTGACEYYALEEILHIQNGVDPANDRVGYAPLRACPRELAVINASVGYLGGILKNAGATNIVVSPTAEGMLTEEQADQIRELLWSRISGEDAGSSLVFHTPVNLQTLAGMPKDMLLGDVEASHVARVCAAFGVNPMVLGLPDPQKTYSNYREAVRAAWNGSVIPVLDAIADAVNETGGLCYAFDPAGRLRLGWDYSSIEELAEDRKILADVASTLWEKGVAMRNEARDMLGLPPVPSGDVFVDELSTPTPPPPGPDGMDQGDSAPPPLSVTDPEAETDAEDSAAA